MAKQEVTRIYEKLVSTLNHSEKGLNVLLNEAKMFEEVIDRECSTRYSFVDNFLLHHKDTPGKVHLLVRTLIKIMEILTITLLERQMRESLQGGYKPPSRLSNGECLRRIYDKPVPPKHRKLKRVQRRLRRSKGLRSSLQQREQLSQVLRQRYGPARDRQSSAYAKGSSLCSSS